ncbi:hypothetical protein PM082_018246 [Marasmius tenuissimus]|nr:hypothetical protein PM082_018246 [Marasmius tenuissimus]
MRHPGYVSVLDLDYLYRAFQHFGSLKKALNKLRSVGDPPFSTTHSAPQSPELHIIFKIFAALLWAGLQEPRSSADTPTLGSVLRERTSLFFKWIEFLLRTYVFDESIPLTSEDLEALDHTLSFSPYLLSYYPDKVELGEKVRSYASMHGLLVQGFCKAVERNHPSWTVWANGLNDIAFPDGNHEVATPVREMTMGPYRNNSALGIIFVRHINLLARRIPKMELWEMYSFKTLLDCLEPGACFPGPDTVFRPGSVREYSIPALVRIISKFRRRKSSTSQDPTMKGDEVVVTRGVANIALTHLKWLVDFNVDGPYWVSKTIDSGIISAITKAPLSFFHPEAHIMAMGEPEGYFAGFVVPIFSRISTYLPYPSVLHSFRPILQKFASQQDLEEEMKAKSDELWDLWCMMKRKAAFFQDLVRVSKEGPLSMCCHENCPLSVTRSTHGESSSVRYSRCSSCADATYCSRHCQKLDWKMTHREKCKQLTAEHLDGLYNPSEYDYRFLQVYLDKFVEVNLNYILSSLDSHRRKLATKPDWTLSQKQRQIKGRLSSPLVAVAFMKPGLATAEECVRLYDGDEAELDFFQWQSNASPDVHVIAMFPGNRIMRTTGIRLLSNGASEAKA